MTNLGYRQLQGFLISENVLTLWSQYFNAITQSAQTCNIALEKSGTAKQNLVCLDLVPVKVKFSSIVSHHVNTIILITSPGGCFGVLRIIVGALKLVQQVPQIFILLEKGLLQ